MKIGIIGGTFNPIHLGHIKLAEGSFKKLRLDKVIFIPAYVPPHKLDKKNIIPWQDRYRMVELAIEGKDIFTASDVEMRLKGRSYSINTIKEFKKIYGDAAEIFFITGSDYTEELESWKDIEDLKRLCRFVIATRPGYAVRRRPPNTMAIDISTPDISSTDIRRRIEEGRRFESLVPKAVYNYIIRRRLYSKSAT